MLHWGLNAMNCTFLPRDLQCDRNDKLVLCPLISPRDLTIVQGSMNSVFQRNPAHDVLMLCLLSFAATCIVTDSSDHCLSVHNRLHSS